MTQHDTVEARVERGFEFLTDWLGVGWWDAVDLDTLDLSSCKVCVLGQLAPMIVAGTHLPWRSVADYTDARLFFGWDVDDATSHGFTTEIDLDTDTRRMIAAKFGALTVAWRERILQARTEQPAVTATRELVAA